MKYRVRKLCKSYTNPKKNPFAHLLAKASGTSNPPKARQGYQQFMRERYHDVIEPEVKKQWAKKLSQEGIPSSKAPGTGFRAAVARQLFKELPDEEQAAFKKRAQDEAAIAREAYDKRPINTTESRTRALEAVPHFLAPLLEGLAEITGRKFVVIYGGPNPRYEGGISVDVLTSNGTTVTNPPMRWTQWDPARFDQMVGSFNDWLMTCYTADDIKAAQGPVPPISDKDPLILDDDSDDDDDDFCAFGEPMNDSDEEHSSSELDELDDDDDDNDSDSDTTVVPPKKRPRAATTTERPTKRQKGDTSSVWPGHRSNWS